MRWVLVGALLGGCYAPEPIAGVRCGANGACPDGFVCSPATDRCERDATGLDGSIPDDGDRVDAPPGCFGTGVVSVCPQVEPTEPLMLSGMLDTVAAPICVPYEGPPGLCVIAGTDISVLGSLTVTGERPLVIVATRTITVGTRIDASSRRSGVTGPAANAAACVAYGMPQNRRGGAGGSFGGVGGKGGGQNNQQMPAPAVTTVTALRGGCRGSSGSNGDGQPGTGGAGGGAIALIAGEMITITGTINASGAGGAGGPEEGGGAGGGSGGMVVLDAPTVRIVSTGSVFANGGGGGGSGAGTQPGQGGTESTTALAAANGGVGGAGGGARGGNGSVGATMSGQDGVTGQDELGSGGGGGAGVIKVYAPSRVIDGTLSPPPT